MKTLNRFLLTCFVVCLSLNISGKDEITIFKSEYLDKNPACPKTEYSDGYWVEAKSTYKAYEWKITGGYFKDKFGQLKDKTIVYQNEILSGRSYVTVIWNNVKSKDGKEAPKGTITIDTYSSGSLTSDNINGSGKIDQEIKSLNDLIPPSLSRNPSSAIIDFGKRDVRVFLSGPFNFPGVKINGFPVPVKQYEWQIPSGWTAKKVSKTPTGTYITSTADIELVTDAASGGEVMVRGINDCDGSGDYSKYSWPITFTRKMTVEFSAYPQTVPFGEAGTYTFSVMPLSGVSFLWEAPAGWSINEGGNTYSGHDNVVSITTSACPSSQKVRVSMVQDGVFSPATESPTTVAFPAINVPAGEIKQYQPSTFSLNIPDDKIASVEWLVNNKSAGVVTNKSSCSFVIYESGKVKISAKITLNGCSPVTTPEKEVDVTKAPDPYISGPATILGQATYTIKNFELLPAGATVQWSVSNTNLTQLSANGSTVVYRSDFYGECSIQATVSFNDVSIKLTPYTVLADIDLGKLNNVYITGPSFVCGLTAEFTLKNLPDSSWVNWDRGAFTSDNSSPYTMNMSSFSGNPGIASVVAEIRYKGKPQGIVHKYKFSFNFPNTQYVEDSVIMNQGVYYDSYMNTVSASFAYLYPSSGINYEWSCSERDWYLVSGGTDYAMFEGPPVTGYITIKMSFTNPCGKRTNLIRELYLPDHLYGNYSPFKIMFDSSSNMLKIEIENELANQRAQSNQSVNELLPIGNYEIQVWSSSGMQKRYLTDQIPFHISMGSLPKGFYFVRVIKEEKVHTHKFMK